MPTLPGSLKTLLKVGVSALALYLVFRKLDGAQLWTTLRSARISWLLVATALFVASKVLSALRLAVLFDATGLRLPALFTLRLYWLGMFYNLFLPGGIGGDGYKVYYLNRLTGTGVRPLLTATLLDRLIGLLPVLSLTLALAGWLPAVPVPGWLAVVGIGAVHLTAGGVMRRFFPDYAPTLGRTTFQSLGVQVLQCASIWALLRATSAPGPPEAYQFVFLISSVVATIPFTIGGAGARELTFLAGAQYFGLPADAAVAVSLLFYGITALVSLTGAYYSWNDTTRQQTYRL